MITIKQLDKFIGRRRGWYKKESEDIYFARQLVSHLYNYNYDTLKEFVESNNYELKRLVENVNIVVVIPKNTGHFAVLYNLSEDCNKGIISYSHKSSDNVDSIAFDLMLYGNYKCLLINGFSIAASNEPSPYSDKKTDSNADHSPSSSFSDFLDEFVNHSEHKDYYMVVCHGMASSRKNFDVWHISSTSKRTKKSYDVICFWMCVAWALSDKLNVMKGKTNYDFSEFYTLQKDGTKKFLTGKEGPNCYFWNFNGPTTSLSSHIMNAGKITKQQGRDSGRVCHIENGITSLGTKSYHVAMYHKEAFRLMNLASSKNMKEAPRDLNQLVLWLETP